MLRTLFHPLSLTAYTALLFSFMIAAFPGHSLEAALKGISIWWTVLFPALFPFFVISEMMLGTGIVHFLGKLLDPLMRPLFKVPGIGGFVFAMGYISGYPVGARLTAQLYEKGLINRIEGERLVSFTTSSDPIFLIGAVSVGFFQNAAIAPILAVAHYGGGFLVGLAMRFYGNKEEKALIRTVVQPRVFGSRLKEALHAMYMAKKEDRRTLGKLMQDSVQSALRLMIVVGGLVVFFSVIMELLTQTGLIEQLAVQLTALFQALGLPGMLSTAVLHGLFEVTLGAQSAGEASSSASYLMHQAAIAAGILSWGGLSVHAQIASLLGKTSMRYLPLLVARLIHAIFAMLLVYILWGLLGV